MNKQKVSQEKSFITSQNLCKKCQLISVQNNKDRQYVLTGAVYKKQHPKQNCFNNCNRKNHHSSSAHHCSLHRIPLNSCFNKSHFLIESQLHQMKQKQIFLVIENQSLKQQNNQYLQEIKQLTAKLQYNREQNILLQKNHVSTEFSLSKQHNRTAIAMAVHISSLQSLKQSHQKQIQALKIAAKAVKKNNKECPLQKKCPFYLKYCQIYQKYKNTNEEKAEKINQLALINKKLSSQNQNNLKTAYERENIIRILQQKIIIEEKQIKQKEKIIRKNQITSQRQLDLNRISALKENQLSQKQKLKIKQIQIIASKNQQVCQQLKIKNKELQQQLNHCRQIINNQQFFQQKNKKTVFQQTILKENKYFKSSQQEKKQFNNKNKQFEQQINQLTKNNERLKLKIAQLQKKQQQNASTELINLLNEKNKAIRKLMEQKGALSKKLTCCDCVLNHKH